MLTFILQTAYSHYIKESLDAARMKCGISSTQPRENAKVSHILDVAETTITLLRRKIVKPPAIFINKVIKTAEA